MGSQTFIAHEIFAALWYLELLSSLRRASEIVLPFDAQFASDLSNQAMLRNHLLQSLIEFCGFDPDIRYRGESSYLLDRPTESTNQLDGSMLTANLIIAGEASSWARVNMDQLLLDKNGNLTLDFHDTRLINKLIDDGIYIQILRLFDGLLEGRFCFNRTPPTRLSDVAQVVRLTYGILGSASPWGEKVFDSKIVFHWKSKLSSEDSSNILDEEYLDWLNWVIAQA